MRLATWNVNSLGARRERFDEWLGSVSPDIVCLQETKLATEALAPDAFGEQGYVTLHHGEGRWNGVAILARSQPDEVIEGFAPEIEPDTDARLLSARFGSLTVMSVYVPNGRAVDDDHYHYKLSWLERLVDHLDRLCDPNDEVVIMGDWNIAPADVDVWSVAAMEGSTHVTDRERSALGRLVEWGMVDVFRELHPETGLYSWWDYRGGAFHKRQGLRIDYALLSHPLARRCRRAIVDRNARKGSSPSDHAPVVYELADS